MVLALMRQKACSGGILERVAAVRSALMLFPAGGQSPAWASREAPIPTGAETQEKPAGLLAVCTRAPDFQQLAAYIIKADGVYQLHARGLLVHMPGVDPLPDLPQVIGAPLRLTAPQASLFTKTPF